MCARDINNDAIRIKRFGEKSCIDDEGRAVQA